jgi:hypothetical protein
MMGLPNVNNPLYSQFPSPLSNPQNSPHHNKKTPFLSLSLSLKPHKNGLHPSPPPLTHHLPPHTPLTPFPSSRQTHLHSITTTTKTHHHSYVLQPNTSTRSLNLRRCLHSPLLQLPPIRPLPLPPIPTSRFSHQPSPPSPLSLQVRPLRFLCRLLCSLLGCG